MHWIDPASLPETRGKLLHFLLNPNGELDGLVLSRGRVVHFPPHMSTQVGRNLAVGDEVRIRALRPKGVSLLAAVSLTGRDGIEIVDQGPEARTRKHKRLKGRIGEVAGTVSHQLHGPRGELRGALLDTGVSLRVPPHAAQQLAEYFAVGAHVQARGRVIKNRFGTVVDVSEIAFFE